MLLERLSYCKSPLWLAHSKTLRQKPHSQKTKRALRFCVYAKPQGLGTRRLCRLEGLALPPPLARPRGLATLRGAGLTLRCATAHRAPYHALFIFFQAAAPPCFDSMAPTIPVTGARSDESEMCHCERSEAIRSLSFASVQEKRSKADCRAPLSLINSSRHLCNGGSQ